MPSRLTPLIYANFHPTLDLMRGGDVFATQELNDLLKDGLITNAIGGSLDNHISIPVTWTMGDETKNSEPDRMLALLAALLKNGIEAHDDRLMKVITKDDFVASPYMLSPVQEVPGQNAFFYMITTFYGKPLGR